MAVSPCFDAGSDYCPCVLAELGQCVACSLIRGEPTCKCGWSGLCIYAEFLRAGSKARPRRRELSARILSREEIARTPRTRAFLLELEVPKELSAWCEAPGSFVLVRPRGLPERFNVPLSVMSSRDGILTLAVQVVGPKTVALEGSSREGRQVTLVGPFWAGIQGLEHLSRHAGGSVLIVAKGIAQACVVPAARYVNLKRGTVRALLGGGTLGSVFVLSRLLAAGASAEVLPKEDDHNLGRISSELSAHRYDVLLSAGADVQHNGLRQLLKQMEDPPAFAWTSNFSMTCAEGICGSCLTGGLRSCKAHIPESI
ncbi:MAG TPA: hypothetical protein GX500_07425 [Firmicutes bacterium]|nr:hypothetical protein [Candidatus Fermentithermobacillaceae bacterium]